MAGLSAIVAVGALGVVSLDGTDEAGSTTTSAPLPALETLPLAEGAADIVWLRLPAFDPVADDTAFELDDFDLRAAIVEGAAVDSHLVDAARVSGHRRRDRRKR